jgi:hypothetical protein
LEARGGGGTLGAGPDKAPALSHTQWAGCAARRGTTGGGWQGGWSLLPVRDKRQRLPFRDKRRRRRQRCAN